MTKCAVIIIALASGAAAAERRHVSEVWSPEQTAAAGWVHRGNSSAAPSVESENDRVGCGAMLTRRSGSRAIGSPPRSASAKSAGVAIFQL